MNIRSEIINSDLLKFTQDKFSKDLQRFEKKLKTDPDNFNLINDKGTALCALGRLEEGIICFDKVNELNPNDLEATFNKGNALSELKKYDEAIKCFERLHVIQF